MGVPVVLLQPTEPKSIEVGGVYINDFRRFTELKTAADKFIVTPEYVAIDAYATSI